MSQLNYNIYLMLEKKSNHIRGLAKSLGTNQTTISRRMKELEEQNIVDYSFEGKNKVYYIKDNLEAKQYGRVIENYRLLLIIQEQPRLRRIIEKIHSNKDIKMAILFGSYANKTQHKNSDIDIYIETKDNSIKKELELMDTKLSIKIGDFYKETALAKEIQKNRIILKGIDRYYEIIYKENV
ncbi:MAG: nucleotidyltransferase domain-containing protein [Candidatus Woesearchaeota archaeon]